MGEHATDDGVFIRSMATRGHLGGLAWATPQALRVLDAAGCDVVLIETVGVGQSEIEIVALADTTVVLLAPGAGDGVQAAKAGVLEIADVFVVNKADRDGADAHRPGPAADAGRGIGARAGRSGRSAGGPRSAARWPPAARASASWSARSMSTGGGWTPPVSGGNGGWPGPGRRSRPSRWSGSGPGSRRSAGRGGVPVLAERVLDGELDPYRAADELAAQLDPGRSETHPGGRAAAAGPALPRR